MPAVEDGEFESPPAKRQRVTTNSGGSQQKGSRIFTPFRTLGLVSPTTVPFTSVPLGKTTFQITTSVGRSLQTYDLRHGLNLVFLSRPQTPEQITATCAWKDRVLAAWGGRKTGDTSGIWIFKRGKKLGELEKPHGLKGSIDIIIALGSWFIASTGNTIEIWKAATLEHYTTLTPATGQGSGNNISTLCHMPTFLNKVFAGTRDGNVEIWNISTGKLVYTIPPASSDCGPVTTLQSTPALSLLAIAYQNGSLVIQDVRTDQEVIQLRTKTSNKLPIHSISFRTDGIGAGEEGTRAGVMATASNGSGDVTMWDLNDGGRIVGVLRGAHKIIASDYGVSGGINRIEFLPGQPVIVSTGLDNSLRSWILDETPFSPIPRALHSRSGHGAPVTTLNFLPASSDGTDSMSKWLLSGGKDRSLWGFSLRRDGQSAEISQGNVQKRTKKMAGSLSASLNNAVEDLKAPEITCIACSLNRDGGMGAIGGGQVWANAKSKNAEESNITGWESVVTAHKGDRFARTWFWGKKKAGRWAFETGDAGEVKSVAISSCGTFALLGSASGGIDMFNLQSGMHRQRFPSKLTPAQARKLRMQQISSGGTTLDGPQKFGLGEGKHTKAVTGVMVDALNKTVISCGLDGKVKFWEFLSGQLQDQLDWHPMTAITALRYNSSSDLIALSCDDLSIRVVDIETKKLVRELWGCVGQINDLCFSNDGRWIIAVSMDSTLRVWDLPTGHLIDAFRTKSTCTALAFSDTGEYLATSHADDMGINIWNNRSLFLHIPARHISEDEVRDIVAPTVSGEGGSLTVDAAYDQNSEDETILALGGVSSVEQITQDMLTLSVIPKTRWQTLLHLDTIKERNKPMEPPKAPEKAPFFLPSLLANGSKPNQQSDNDTTQMATPAEKSRISNLAQTPETQFTSLLRSSSNRSPLDFAAFISHMKSLSPSATDLEIRSLRLAEMPALINALTSQLGEKRDYELVNAWMAVFLRLHGEVVVSAVSGKDAGDGMDDADENGALLVEKLAGWKREQESEGKRLGELVSFASAVINWVRSERG